MTDQDLSSLVDGECSRSQLDRALRQLREDPKARARLSRWTLLGDVLRGVDVRKADPGFADRVMAALPPARTPAEAAPAPGRMAWGPLAGLAAAAGVGAVAVLALQPDPAAEQAPNQPVAAATPVEPAPLASLEQAQAEQLRSYVMAYSQSRARQGMSATLGHARYAAYAPGESDD